jgi:predicted peroxiredoxin
MANYLLFESRDVLDSADAQRMCDLAIQLKRAGDEVVLFLVQNATFSARTGAVTSRVHQAIAAGVHVLADELALEERGITPSKVVGGVTPAPIGQAIGLLAAGWKAAWH